MTGMKMEKATTERITFELDNAKVVEVIRAMFKLPKHAKLELRVGSDSINPADKRVVEFVAEWENTTRVVSHVELDDLEVATAPAPMSSRKVNG